MLSNFQLGTQGLLQSFLVGQPQLRRMMRLPEMEQLSQRVIASYHLGPMDRTETEAYIKHRLKLAGWANDPTLDRDVYDGIFQYSGGLPRQINTITNHLLLAGCLAEKHKLTGTDIDKVIEEVREDFADGPEVNTGSKRAADVKGRTASKPVAVSKPDAVAIAVRESGLTRLEDRIRELERNLADMGSALEERVNGLHSSRQAMLLQMDQTLSRFGDLLHELAQTLRDANAET